jgi:molybdenum cofactor guanylyltransferase
MINASGFITAGGRSARMGRDKAWLEIGGRPMIEHVIEALKPVTSSIAIIANNDEYKRLGFPVFADTIPGVGPLEAIRTALTNSPAPFIVLTGCDMPFVTSELFSLLLNIASQPQQKTPDSGLQTPDFPLAVAPLNEEGKLEPLCALYSTQALEAITRLIESGVRKVSILFERIPARLISFDQISHLPNARFFFENINTPEEYERAVKKI